MWVGDKDRLLRLVRVMDEITEGDRTSELAKKQVELDRKFEINKEFHSDPSAYRESLEEEYEATRLKLSPSMEVVEREISLTRRGEAAEVVEGMDPPAVVRLELSAPRELLAPNRAVLRMSRAGSCTLEVKGSNPTWLYSAREALSSEIQRGVPWWALLRRPFATFASAAVIYCALILAVWESISFEGGINTFWEKIAAWALIGFIAIPIIAIILDWLIGRLIPGIEIMTPGATPKSGKALGFIGSMAASFVLGIVVNLITS